MALCTCFLDEQAKAQLRINRAIERDLVQWKKDNSKEFKLLLLGTFSINFHQQSASSIIIKGTGEAGKSTFIKQMRIIHGAGYTDADRAQFRVLVYRNIFLGMKLLTEAMKNLKIDYYIPANKVFSASWKRHFLLILCRGMLKR